MPGAAQRGAEQYPAQHGPARQLPLRALAAGRAETGFHQPADQAGRGCLRAVVRGHRLSLRSRKSPILLRKCRRPLEVLPATALRH